MKSRLLLISLVLLTIFIICEASYRSSNRRSRSGSRQTGRGQHRETSHSRKISPASGGYRGTGRGQNGATSYSRTTYGSEARGGYRGTGRGQNGATGFSRTTHTSQASGGYRGTGRGQNGATSYSRTTYGSEARGGYRGTGRGQNGATSYSRTTYGSEARGGYRRTGREQYEASQTQSEIKCVDNNSSASDCFDYFVFAVTWSPGYAYKHNINVKKNSRPRWVIHGLWPSAFEKVVPPECSLDNIYFAEHKLSNQLKSFLEGTWFNIATGQGNARFWEHELKEHGRCAARSPVIGDSVGYFTKTFELYQTLDIFNTLANQRYREGVTKPLKDILNILEAKAGAKVKIIYTPGENEGEYYLAELQVCYDILLSQAIHCPDANKTNLNVNITYLNRMLK